MQFWDTAQRTNLPELGLSEQFRSLLISGTYDLGLLRSLFKQGAIPDLGEPNCWPILFLCPSDIPPLVFAFVALETSASHVFPGRGNESIFQHLIVQKRFDLIRLLLEHRIDPQPDAVGITNLETFILCFMGDRETDLLDLYMRVRGELTQMEYASLISSNYPPFVLERMHRYFASAD